jgi:sugar lactone lactonase YvrE
MAGKPHPSDWRNAAPSTQRLALLALLGMLGGVVLVNHFSAAAAGTVGPTLLARNAAGETLLANGSTLYLVDSGETRTLNFPATDLGLHGAVLSISSDGRDWYLGDDATGMLYRCDLRARRCAAALQPQPDARIFRRAHHVAFAGSRIFITDSEAHRLLVFDRDGTPAGSTRTGPLELCFPNGIVAADDSLYVADTNNFRVARLAIASPAQSSALLRTHTGAPIERANCNAGSAALARRGSPVLNTVIDSSNTVARDARAPARPGRVWPASVLHASSGEWWVVQMANRMRMGDVIRYGADGRPLARIELPPDADPIELIEAHGQVLITDAALTRVHRVSLQGQVSGAWGPPDLRALLGTIHAERRMQRSLQYLSCALIGAGLLAALAVIVLELRRKRAQGWSTQGTLQPVAVQADALRNQTVWIPLDAQVVRRLRRVLWLLVAYVVASVAVFSYLGRDLRLDTVLGRFQAFTIGSVLIVVLTAGVFGAVNLGRLPRRRIGVSRGQVRYDPGSGEVVESRWEDVRVSPRAMLVGRHVVQIIDNRGRHLYPQAEIDSQLLGRLQPTAFISNFRLVLETLRRGNVGAWSTAAMLAIYLAFLLLRWLHPEWLPGLGPQIVELLR